MSDPIYVGKAKSVYATDNPHQLRLLFRDDLTAFNGEKLDNMRHKGALNNQINAYIMTHLEAQGVKTHFIRSVSNTESIVHALVMLPIECVVRNYAAGSLVRRLGIPQGQALTPPVFEFFLKNDALQDPFINASHVRTFGWASDHEMAEMEKISMQVNEILTPLFLKAGFLLVDYKLEFGRLNGQLVLADEFTPDGCRLWDSKTREKFDKDRFRQDLGGVIEAYQQVAARLQIPIHDD